MPHEWRHSVPAYFDPDVTAKTLIGTESRGPTDGLTWHRSSWHRPQPTSTKFQWETGAFMWEPADSNGALE